MKYDAFISYRHTPLDMEMAKRLHKGLETFKVPRAVRLKTGKKNIKRVFRDQEELPIGSDLDENIKKALQESEYLIVVCSPNTPKSEWVCKEIETFIKLHDRNHVLAMLIEGEPDESFPSQILVDENNTPVEPLAADVRGETPKERNKKFKTELLRLAASVLGCNYDDLRQRHRERIIRQTAMIVSGIAAVVAVAGISFGLYSSNIAKKMKLLADEKAQLADEKTKLAEDILVEYREKQKNQSRFYAQNSLSLLKSGDRRAAVLMAAQGLPGETNDRPYVPEAEYALSEALYTYDIGSERKFDRILSGDFMVTDMSVDADGKKLVTLDNGDVVTVWDTETWDMLIRIQAITDEKNYVVDVVDAGADDSGVYIVDANGVRKYDYESNLIYTLDAEASPKGMVAASDKEHAYLICREKILIFSIKDGKVIRTIENGSDQTFTSKYVYDAERDALICGHYGIDALHAVVSVHHIQEDDKDSYIELSQEYITGLCYTGNGHLATLSCNSDFTSEGVKEPVLEVLSYDGKRLWSKVADVNIFSPATFSSNLKAHDYDVDGKHRSTLVLTMEHDALCFDETNGEMLSSLDLSGDIVTLNLAKSSGLGYVGYSTGNLVPVNFDEGVVYSDYETVTDLNICDVLAVGDQMYISALRSADVYVLSFHKDAELTEFVTTDERVTYAATSDDDSYIVTCSLEDYKKYLFYDKQGKLLYTFDKSDKYIDELACAGGICILCSNDAMWFVDPFKQTADKVTYESIGTQDSYMGHTFTKNGNYIALWKHKDLSVVDTKTRKEIYSTQTDDYVGNAVVSEDGRYLYVAQKEDVLLKIDIESDAVESFSKEFIGLANYSSNKYIELSHDGRYIAMCCMDGAIRIADTADLSVRYIIPYQIKSNTFLRFSDDDKGLVVQGDDYKVRIWDMEKAAYSTTVDSISNMKYVICDEEDGLMAVSDGYRTILFETGSYGMIAYIPQGMTYLKSENTFILKNNKDMYMIPYKDSNKLLEEAAKEFGDSAFTEEEKTKYNIE